MTAAIAGRIASVPARVRDEKKAGDPLVLLDSAEEASAVAAAEADLGVADAELRAVLRGLRREEVDAIVAEATSAKARAEASNNLLAYDRASAADRLLSERELARSLGQAQADQASAGAAEARRRAATNGSPREEVALARAKVSAAAARVEQARARLELRTVRAPTDGTVLDVGARAGEFHDPQAGTPLLVFGDLRRLRVRARLDEQAVGRVQVGAGASVEAQSLPGVVLPGKVAEVASRVARDGSGAEPRPDIGTFEVLIDLETTDRVVPGQLVIAYVDVAALP